MRLAWLGLTALTALRLAVAGFVPLSPDETYYWVWSRALAPGYLDHPPVVALCIRAGTALLGDTPLGVRLLAPVMAAAGTVLLASAAASLFGDRRAGILAAALLSVTLLAGIGAVTMTPDTPQLFFWTVGLWAVARVGATGRGTWWLVAGVATGFGLASKYTTLFLPAGIALWLLTVPSARVWLRRPHPWAAALLALAAFTPVLIWNDQHDWASLVKQGGRVADWEPSRAVQYLAELLGSQIALATPLVFVLCAAGATLAVRRGVADRDPAWTLLACLSLPAVAVFAWHALGDRVQGNWPAIIYPAAAIAAARLQAPVWRRMRTPALALGLGMTLAVYVQAIAAPLRLSIYTDPTLLRLAGWGDLAASVEEVRERTGASFVAADNYGVASEMAWWLPSAVPVVGIEPRWALFDLAPASIAGEAGILLRSERRRDAPDAGPWAEIAPIAELVRGRDGIPAEGFRLYRVVARKSPAVTAILPRPRR